MLDEGEQFQFLRDEIGDGAQRLPVVAAHSLPLWRDSLLDGGSEADDDSGDHADGDVHADNGDMHADDGDVPADDEEHADVADDAAAGDSGMTVWEPIVSAHPGPPRTQWYVGAAGSGAPFHYHEDAINTLIYGEKRWYLHPPQRAEYSTVTIGDYVTRILRRLPAAERPYQCTQLAGDVMYVPHGWGHGVLNMATSIGFASEFYSQVHFY